jgi:CHAT domain-containing protein
MSRRGINGIRWAAATAALALPSAAYAQSPSAGADALCTPAERMEPAAAFPSDAALTEKADGIEQMLAGLRARGDASGAPPAQLEVPLTTAAPPAPLALARYCAAAGELMRLSAQGSQLQAQNYLLAAYRLAEGSGDPLASRAAYRLALVGASEPGADGTRGASTGRRRGSGPVVPLEERAMLPADTACDELTASGLALLSAREVSHMALSCAAERSLAAGDRALAALSNLKLARLEGAYAELPGQDREAFRGFALERAQRAIPMALEPGAEADRAELIGRLAEAAVEYGDRGSIELKAAIANLEARAGNPEAASIAASLKARLALLGNDQAGARLHAEQAIFAESQRPVPARLPLLYLLLADTDPARRAQHVNAAYVALENLRPLLPRLDPLTEESSFSLYMRSVFTAAAEVQLASTTSGTEAVQVRRAQEIVETFRQAELQSAFGSECLPARAATDLENLLPGETILYPLLLPDRVELLVVSRDQAGGTEYRRLPPNRNATRADVARLVEQVALTLSYGEGEAWKAPARQLYDILIAPVADRLGPDRLLAVVPDGPLRALPFAALVAPDGRFLVQQTRLSTIPALAFSQPSEGRRDTELSIVAASLQREVDLPVGAFTALQGTEEEARIAVRYAAQGEFVPDFTRGRLIKALERPIDVLHLATHAAFNGRSDRAFIVANGEVIRLSELRDMIGKSGLRGDAIDLIVLSACETAVGDDEASMGLAGAAVQAGARSVIGSLWQVDDSGTAELMRQFYQRYAGGSSRSAALRDAQLALIDGGGANADPNIWAAFTLLGAWR